MNAEEIAKRWLEPPVIVKGDAGALARSRLAAAEARIANLEAVVDAARHVNALVREFEDGKGSRKPFVLLDGRLAAYDRQGAP